MTPAMAEACVLVKHLGLVPSYRNLYIIELAIESESAFSSISLQEARIKIVAIGRDALQAGESLDYFWFEDCCWRNPKLSFKERDELRAGREARVGLYVPPPSLQCSYCNDRGYLFNPGSGQRTIPCPECRPSEA